MPIGIGARGKIAWHGGGCKGCDLDWHEVKEQEKRTNMQPLKPPTEREKSEIVRLIDAANSAARSLGVSRVTVNISHDFDESPMPHVLDYLESIDCRVENILTVPKNNGDLHREVIYKIGDCRPWDGSVDVEVEVGT